MNVLINIGYENTININKVTAVLNYGKSSSKRIVSNAKEKDLLIDATEGNKTLSILVTDNGQVVTSAVKAETIKKRFCK